LTEYIRNAIHKRFEIVIYLDANENMDNGRIAKSFKELGLIETTSSFTTDPAPNTFITGSTLIDAVWVSPNIALVALSMIPFYFKVGNHRVFIINFILELLYLSLGRIILVE